MEQIKKHYEEFMKNIESVKSNDNESLICLFMERIQNTNTANFEIHSVSTGPQMYDMLMGLISQKPQIIPILLDVINRYMAQTKATQPPLMGQGGET